MEHRQLLNFLAVCEEKSFTRAAERRFITQQGLSRSIQELERETGVPLFDRNRRGAALTEYGQVLESAVRAYTNQHEYILETLKTMKEKSGARLSLGIAVDCPLPRRFLADFIVEHPEIRLSVNTFPIDVCQRHLLEQRLQAGFSYPPVDTELFESFLFSRVKVHLITGMNHPLAKRKSVKMSELRGENIIAFTTALHPNSALLELLRQNGIVPDTRLGSLDYALVAELCSTGRYIGFGRKTGELAEVLKDLTEIEIEDAGIYAELYFIVNRRAFINQAAETFIEYARDYAENRAEEAG